MTNEEKRIFDPETMRQIMQEETAKEMAVTEKRAVAVVGNEKVVSEPQAPKQ